jgi:hypothetical protein
MTDAKHEAHSVQDVLLAIAVMCPAVWMAAGMGTGAVLLLIVMGVSAW